MGVVKYTDGTIEKNSLVGFHASGQYEFVIDGQRLYRVLSNLITIQYEYQGDEETYNPSWACLLYTSPSPRDRQKSRMPSSA